MGVELGETVLGASRNGERGRSAERVWNRVSVRGPFRPPQTVVDRGESTTDRTTGHDRGRWSVVSHAGSSGTPFATPGHDRRSVRWCVEADTRQSSRFAPAVAAGREMLDRFQITPGGLSVIVGPSRSRDRLQSGGVRHNSLGHEAGAHISRASDTRSDPTISVLARPTRQRA